MTVAKLKTSAAFLALALGAVLAIAQIGCLTPETKAQIVTLQSNLDRGQATVLQLKTELEKYRGDMAAVVADVKAGKVPLASGLKLADEIMANMTATQQRLADALAVVDS
ncbi:MAG TPA: hypothetical protein PK280_20800, partial [Planctomycetota bacterium]|nr:hypothetical protein [Planctomycetota bacterium]